MLLDYDQPQPDADDLDAEEEEGDEEDRLRANYDTLAAVTPDYPEPEDDLTEDSCELDEDQRPFLGEGE